MLQHACAKTPWLTFVGHQLAATEQQQGEKSPPHPLPAPPLSFGSITSTSKMSQGDFGDNDDVDDAFLEELMSTDIDLAAHVADISVTCRKDTKKLPNLALSAPTCRHHFLPIWPFPRIFMSENGDMFIVM